MDEQQNGWVMNQCKNEWMNETPNQKLQRNHIRYYGPKFDIL